MSIDKEAYLQIINQLQFRKVSLVAVSKTKSVEEIKNLYDSGQKDFGENYVQELTEKKPQLPQDIRWHFIGHLQSNKVKQITPFIHLIQSVDSIKLLKEINTQAEKNKRVIDCLLQIHTAQEETKFGLDEKELEKLIDQFEESEMKNVKISGLMGMASLTDNMEKVRSEFKYLKSIFDKYSHLKTTNFNFQILSMGMSSDYKIAIEEGSNMIRIGSLIFGVRD
jgi:pyridoxal phosphate enzyme (YggS family)